MSLRTLFIVNAVITGLLGIGMIVAPDILGAMGEVQPGTMNAHQGRTIGSLAIGIALISWLVRNEGPSNARDAIAVGFSLIYALLTIEIIRAIVIGVVKVIFLGEVVVFGLLAVGFFLYGRPILRSTSS